MVFVLLVGTLLGIRAAVDCTMGTGGFGPEYVDQVTIKKLYTDRHARYMARTDRGLYKISNFLYPIRFVDCDEMYSKLEVGKTYLVKIKGNKVINQFIQEYPYIIEVRW